MYCSGCGQGLLAGQGYCPQCGMAQGPGYAGGWMAPLAVVERRVNALSVAWLVYAGLVMVTGAVGLAFLHTWMGGPFMGPFPGPWGWHHAHPFWPGLAMPFLWRFAGLSLVARVGLALAAGIGLQQRTRWGRAVAIVAGCLALVHFPFGTGLGIWTLAVLLNRANAAGW